MSKIDDRNKELRRAAHIFLSGVSTNSMHTMEEWFAARELYKSNEAKIKQMLGVGNMKSLH